MAQLVVTVEDTRLLPALEKAIGLLKGVKRVQVEYKLEKKMVKSVSAKQLTDIPANIQELIGIASGLEKKEIDKDDRLSYLLGK